MRGLETAFWGTLGADPELKTGKSGKPFATFNVAVTVGHADDGKDVTQWVTARWPGLKMAVASHTAAFSSAGTPLPEILTGAFLAFSVSQKQRIFSGGEEKADFCARQGEP